MFVVLYLATVLAGVAGLVILGMQNGLTGLGILLWVTALVMAAQVLVVLAVAVAALLQAQLSGKNSTWNNGSKRAGFYRWSARNPSAGAIGQHDRPH